MKKNIILVIVCFILFLTSYNIFASDNIISYYNNKDLQDFEYYKNHVHWGWFDFSMKKYPIIQIVQSSGISGSGFLFNLQIETELYFAAYIKENNKIKLIKMNANQTTIYEDINSNNACVVKMYPASRENKIDETNDFHYNIHIPKNSITNKIDINLK